MTSVTQGSNNVVQATITNHLATPTNPTLTGTDWIIRILPEQNKQILEHAPAGVIPGIALAGGAVGPREAQGLFQKTICKLRSSGWIERDARVKHAVLSCHTRQQWQRHCARR